MPKLETLRAKIGATILDVFRPGWADEIDLDRLDLADCYSCVLGQMFGEYGEGADQLFAMRADEDEIERAAYEAGFTADPVTALRRGGRRLNYGNLTKAWRREIEKRAA